MTESGQKNSLLNPDIQRIANRGMSDKGSQPSNREYYQSVVVSLCCTTTLNMYNLFATAKVQLFNQEAK